MRYDMFSWEAWSILGVGIMNIDKCCGTDEG
jgi:hypothetical protein